MKRDPSRHSCPPRTHGRRGLPVRAAAAFTAGVLLLTSTGLLSGCSPKQVPPVEQDGQTQTRDPNAPQVEFLSRVQLLNFEAEPSEPSAP